MEFPENPNAIQQAGILPGETAAPGIAAEMAPGASMRGPVDIAAMEAGPPRLSAEIAPEKFGVRAGQEYTETVGPRVGEAYGMQAEYGATPGSVPPADINAPWEPPWAREPRQQPVFPQAPVEFTGVEPFAGDPVQQALIEGVRGIPRSVSQAIKDEFLGALGASKSLRSAFDISAVMRQGAILFLRPFQFRQSGQALAKMFKAFRTRDFDAIDRAIATHPDAAVMKAAGVDLPEAAGGLTAGEEAYIKRSGSWIGEKVGRLIGVKQSDQMYQTFIKVQRVNRFLQFKRAIDKGNFSPEQAMEGYKAAAKWANISTGRGSLGQRIDKTFDALNYTIFSPRFVASRLNILNPAMYIKNGMTPAGRVVLRGQMADLVQFLGVVSGIMYGAKQMGADVNFDFNSPDFAKIKFGSWRYDFGAGITQPLRAAYRIAADTIRAGRGEKPQPGKTATDVAENFLSYKLSPPAAFVRDFYKGKTLEGKPFTPARAAAGFVAPMQIADFVDAFMEEGWPGIAKTAIGTTGVGVQNYSTPGAVNLNPQLDQEFKSRGLHYDTVPKINGDTDATHKARANRIEQWTNFYGQRLLQSSSFQRLNPDLQTEAIKNLHRRISGEANMKRPNTAGFNPQAVVGSTLQSERERPYRNRSKIVVPQ
jgi:hypothetical protein